MTSGVFSAFAFFWVTFRVAPARTPALNWAVIIIVGVLGLMAAAGPLMVNRAPIRALAGLAMVGIAVAYARKPVSKVEADLARTVS